MYAGTHTSGAPVCDSKTGKVIGMIFSGTCVYKDSEAHVVNRAYIIPLNRSSEPGKQVRQNSRRR